MLLEKLPFFTIIIPTYNSEKKLGKCLESIMKQEYPLRKREVLIVDGGSEDNTLEICKKYNCSVIFNTKRLAEPGVSLGLKEAQGEIYTILAADNILDGKDWLEKMAKPFMDSSIFAAFPIQVSAENDNWITRYINTFTDPFNHFIYGWASNSRTFGKAYKVLEKTDDYIVYDYNLDNHPILAFAQGFTIREGLKRSEKSESCDILPILEMIREKLKIAYVPEARLIHNTVDSLKHFIKKQRWAASNFFLKKSFGFAAREVYMTNKKKKKYFWIIYALSLFAPFAFSIYCLLRDKKKEWIYHAPLSFITGLIVFYEFIRIKVFRIRKTLDR